MPSASQSRPSGDGAGARARAVSNLPLAGGGEVAFGVEGEPEPAPQARPTAMLRAVAGDYFHVMGIRVVDGRTIGPGDNSSAPPVLMLSQTLARRLFRGET